MWGNCKRVYQGMDVRNDGNGSGAVPAETGERKTCSARAAGTVLCAVFKTAEDFSDDLDAGSAFRGAGESCKRDGRFL